MISFNLSTKKIAVLIGTLIVIGLVACSGPAEREAKYLAKAEKYFADNNIQKAKVEIKNVLQINPKNSNARVILGKVNQKEGDYRQSFANFNAAAEEDPKQVDARIELSKIYLSAGKDEDAKRYISEVLAVEPENIEAKSIISGLYMRAKDFENATKIANEVLQASPGFPQAIAVLVAIYIDSNPELALEKIDQGLSLDKGNVGLKLLKIDVLYRTKRTAETETIYKELIQDNPKNFSFYDRLSANYTAQNRIDEAEAIVREAIKNNPDSTDPILALVGFLKKVKGADASQAALKEFIEKKPDLYILKQTLVQQYLQLDKKDEAKKVLESVIKQDSKSANSISARVDLVKIALSENEIPRANAILEEIFAIEPANTDARIQNARIKISENKVKDAIADLRTAIKTDARSIDAYRLLALVQEKDHTEELALDSYFKALEINNEDIPSLYGAARLSINANKLDSGKKLLERILMLNANNVEANLLLTSVLVKGGEFSEAEKLAQHLIDSDVAAIKATGYNSLGGIYTSQKNWELAKSNYVQSLNISPASYDPLAGVVNSELALNRANDAIIFVENQIKRAPDSVRAKRLLASLYLNVKKTNTAVEIYEELIKSNPEDESLYQSLATIYFDDKNIKKAEATYLNGLEKNPNSVGLRAYLGNLYTYVKNYNSAKTQYELAYSKMPNSDMLKNNLAILLVNHFPSPENKKRAGDLVQSFASSKEPNYLDTLGWVQYQLGNTPQAISYLQQAVGLKGAPEFRYHLGIVLKQNGQMVDAKRELTLAVKGATAESDWIDFANKALVEL